VAVVDAALKRYGSTAGPAIIALDRLPIIRERNSKGVQGGI
jgi:hypothetical protein